MSINFNAENISKEILEKRITDRIEKNQGKIKSVLNKFEHDGTMLKDYVVNLSSDNFMFHDNKMMIGKDYFNLTEHSFSQVADKLNIPRTYARGLNDKKWGKDLLDFMFNEHCTNDTRQRALVRTVDGEVRGFLSDSYRRMNSYQIAKNFIESSMNMGGQIIDGYIDNTKMFIETIRPELYEIDTPSGGTIYISVGSQFRTSDFGDGAIEVRSYIEQAVCNNGLVRNSELKAVHLGSRLHDDLTFSEKTYQLDTQTMASAISDIVINCYSDAKIGMIMSEIMKANNKQVDLDGELKKLGTAKKLTDTEIQEIKNVFIKNDINDGLGDNNSLFRLTQGITAIARNKDGAKKRNLETLAGELIRI